MAVNDNYDPAFGSAKVTITPRTIILTGATDSQVYDGTALTNSDVTIGGNGFLNAAEGYATMPTATGTITVVGTASNPVSGGALNDDTQASDYTITKVPGTLEVTKATLTVKADDKQITYPNNRPAESTLTYTYVSGLVGSETPAYAGALGYDSTVLPATEPYMPGTYADAIVAGGLELRNGTNGFVAANYDLVVEPGDLKVVNGEFSVDLPDGSWTYNGDPHGTTVTGTQDGDTIEYFIYQDGGWVSTGTTPPTVTDVADGPLSVKVVVTRPGYGPAEDEATLTINPATMNVTATGYSDKYDGDPHSITVTPAVTDGTTIEYSTDGTNYTATNPTATDYTAGTTVYYRVTNPNYQPVLGNKTIEIDKRTVTVQTGSDSKTYDGDALTNGDVTPGGDGFVDGEGFDEAYTTGTITDVGSTANTFYYTLLSGTKATNYTIDVTEGTLRVTPSPDLTVSAADVTKMYDGNAYGVTAGANFPAGTTIYYGLTNSHNAADYTSLTSPTATHVSESTTVYFMAVNDNYDPAFGSAKVTITPRDVVVNTYGATKPYDATPLTATGWSYDAASSGFVGSDGFATTATTGTITEVGTAQNGFDYTLRTATEAADYAISVTPGVLTVTPRMVLVSALNADKNYGSTDPAFGYEFTTGTVNGVIYYAPLAADIAGITVNVTRSGSDSAVGEYADVLVPGVNATQAVLKNYAFSTATADFTINPQVVYNLNTTDPVTGFPATEWFDYDSDAALATSDGVKRVGFRLVGWEDTQTGEQISLGGTIPAIDRNYSLNAVWEIALYDTTFESGTMANVLYMPSNILDKQYDTQITIAERKPYYSGYGFLYWMTTDIDGTETHFDPGDTFTMPDNNVTLTAVWEVRTSPIYYHPNGASGGTIEEGRYPTDSDVTVSGNLFSRPGYRFIGWSMSATGAIEHQPGDTFTMPPRQLNFYAQWEQQEYTVTYIVSGGTGEFDGTKTYASYSGLLYGDAMPVPANPTLDGYTFDGWTTVIPATVPDGDLVIYGTMTLIKTQPEVSPTPAPTPEPIPDEDTPLAGPIWALLNLILAIVTALASILMLLGLAGKKKEEEDGVTVRETKKHPVARVLTLLPGIGGIIAFILTENMKNPMAIVDRWTLLMIIIALVQLILVLFGAKKKKKPDDEITDAPSTLQAE